jgi:DNA (cytosine-5)-methyltransferase 1
VKIGSLFSGAAGLDRAVEHVFGAEVAWFAEIDKAASKVLAYRYPDVPNLGDITEINWANWKPMLEVDILCGGFPCQDVSSAGKRAGIKTGTRSGLWSVFADAIDILRPSIVIIENVRGLLSAQAHRNVESDDSALGDGERRPVLRAAGAVLGDLSDLGYDAAWTTLAAGEIGAPHRRERVFIVADSTRNGRDEGRAEPTRKQRGSDAAVSGDGNGLSLELQRLNRMLKPESRWTPEEVAALLPTPRSSDCFGAGLHGDGGMDLRTTVTLLPTPNAQDGNGGGRYSGKPGSGHQSTLPGEARLLCTPSASDGAGGKTSRSGGRINEPLLGGQAREMATAWGKYEPAIRRWEALTRPAPAPTEPNKNGNPRLSAAFSEWLMGWPAGWVTDPAIGISRNDQLKIVGNGVCPQQAAAALRYLLEVTK